VHIIQAAVLRTKGGPLRIETLEMEGPRNDEILVCIVATVICHTDIDFKKLSPLANGQITFPFFLGGIQV